MGFLTYGDLPQALQGAVSISEECQRVSKCEGMRPRESLELHAGTCMTPCLYTATHVDLCFVQEARTGMDPDKDV